VDDVVADRRRGSWRTGKFSKRASTVFGSFRHLTCPMRGMRDTCSKRSKVRFSARIFFSRMATPMHGSAFTGDGEQAIQDLARVMREVLGGN
jgi:hypothetical protein